MKCQRMNGMYLCGNPAVAVIRRSGKNPRNVCEHCLKKIMDSKQTDVTVRRLNDNANR